MKKNKCYWCGIETGDDYHLDHFVPKVIGGRSIDENLVVSCRSCNHSKGCRFWHKTETGIVEKYKSPKQFIDF